ncbi:MAG: CHAT domain-containing protein [Jatrophihabitans sp.]|uniref:CHAT domain-containing protein n=1 Tax=Jatrophihabitans sp. TaxID=1932789 RepID=UPI003F8096DF
MEAAGGADDAATLMRDGLAFVRSQDFRAARLAFTKAALAFEEDGDKQGALRAKLGVANCMSERGDVTGAVRLLEELREDDALEAGMRIGVSANLAVCLARGGDVETAENMWRECFVSYLEANEPVQAAACLHNAALAVHERGRDVRALQLVGGARSVLAQVADAPEELIAACDATAGVILSAMHEWSPAREALSAAITVFEKLGRRNDVGRCHGNLAVCALRMGDLAVAARHADLAEKAFEGGPLAGTQAAMLSLQITLAVEAGDLAAAQQLAQFAVAVAASTQSPIENADAAHNLAVVTAHRGELHDALAQALVAFDFVDEARYSLSSLRDRHALTVSRFEPMVLHALQLASVVAPPDVSAELIERARVAGTPKGIDAPDALVGRFTANPPPSATGGPLSRDLVAPVNRPGPLRLHRNAGVDEPDTSYLSELVEVAAGRGAWWWGTWVQRGHLYWAVRDPGGRVEAGHARVAADILDLARSLAPVPTADEVTLARELASDPTTAKSWAHLAATARVLAGPMTGDCAAADAVNRVLPAPLRTDTNQSNIDFDEAMASLGAVLLPAPLYDAASDEATSGDPVRLVVSIAPGLAWLPLPLLKASTPSGHRHLVEFADLSLFPPWPIAAQLARSAGVAAPPNHVAVSVTDPLGDLRYARRSRPIAASMHLGHRDSGVQQQATPANLRRALRSAPAASMLLYQGHVELTNPSEPLSASFVLTEDGRPCLISAQDIVADRDTWTFPQTVFLDGCESTGTWGSAEWGGLVPALLQRGARQVIATLWPIVEAPAATDVTADIVAATLELGDAARAVSRVQRRLLSHWRQGSTRVTPHHFGAHVVTGASP